MKMKQIHIFHHIIEYFIVSCMAQPLSRIYKNYLLMPLKDFFWREISHSTNSVQGKGIKNPHVAEM